MKIKHVPSVNGIGKFNGFQHPDSYLSMVALHWNSSGLSLTSECIF